MVAPAFGFSVGDFIAGTKLLIALFGGFQEAGGASTKYASESAFLTSLVSTLQHLDDYVKKTPQDDISQEITNLLQIIKGPLDEFKAFLGKYQASLGKAATKTTLAKAKGTVSFTVKDVSGKVERLRRQVEQPLQAVNSLLSLQVLKSIETLPQQPLQQEQLAQIIDAIRVADIPAELDKQIQVLQRSAAEHSVKHDDQLQRIKDLRSKLDGEIAKLQTAVEEIKDVAAATQATNKAEQGAYTDAQLEASRDIHTGVTHLHAALEMRTDTLDSAMTEQKILILALKSFLEDKAAMQERAVAAEDDLEEENDKKNQKTLWPSATLPAAHLAVALLSTVVSSVVATSMARKSQHPPYETPLNMNGGIRSSVAAPNPARRTEEAAASKPTVKTTANTSQSAQVRGSAWASDFSSTTGTKRHSSASSPSYPQPKKGTGNQTSGATNYGIVGPWSGMGDMGWSKRLSKLDDEDLDKPTDGGSNDVNGNSDIITPGPVIPSSGGGAFGDSSGGAIGGGCGGGGSTRGGYSGDLSGGSSSGSGGGYSGGYSGGGYSGGYSGGNSGGYSGGGCSSSQSSSDSDSD